MFAPIPIKSRLVPVKQSHGRLGSPRLQLRTSQTAPPLYRVLDNLKGDREILRKIINLGANILRDEEKSKRDCDKGLSFICVVALGGSMVGAVLGAAVGLAAAVILKQPMLIFTLWGTGCVAAAVLFGVGIVGYRFMDPLKKRPAIAKQMLEGCPELMHADKAYLAYQRMYEELDSLDSLLLKISRSDRILEPLRDSDFKNPAHQKLLLARNNGADFVARMIHYPYILNNNFISRDQLDRALNDALSKYSGDADY